MKVTNMFCPLKNRKSLRVFFIATLVIALIYAIVSIIIALVSLRPFPKGNLLDTIFFALLKTTSTFIIFDWIILLLFPFFGGLLFANYSYWRCGTTRKVGHSGLVFGLLAGTCPVCILPIVGASSFLTIFSIVSVYIKVGALLLIIGTTYYVANKQSKCLSDDEVTKCSI